MIFLISFLSRPRSRNIYHARTYWVLYSMNLVTWVLVKFQQKKILLSTTDLTLKSLCPLVLASGMESGGVNILKHGTSIKIRNKYKNNWAKSDYDSHICNIEHFLFGMVNHYPNQLLITIINKVWLKKPQLKDRYLLMVCLSSFGKG